MVVILRSFINQKTEQYFLLPLSISGYIATPLYKGQKQIVTQVKEGIISLSTSIRKGNFGEIVVDLDFFEKGYKDIHINKVNSIDHPNYQGIDHIFQDEISGQYVIVETKWRNTPISTTLTGRQVSDSWIVGNNRLLNAVGGNDQLASEILTNDYLRVIARVQPDGSIAYRLADSDGYAILGNAGVFNP
uniref:Uncharacterized protein n=1 Tax=uncultured Dokdonia sp. TaxID=575653 RepID=H6RGU0_9FLAO|nr:hypothetical protein [uncultured bacterium]CCG00251.1 conserved hypothetical protein [uncultured Dokdonia sp.]